MIIIEFPKTIKFALSVSQILDAWVPRNMRWKLRRETYEIIWSTNMEWSDYVLNVPTTQSLQHRIQWTSHLSEIPMISASWLSLRKIKLTIVLQNSSLEERKRLLLWRIRHLLPLSTIWILIISSLVEVQSRTEFREILTRNYGLKPKDSTTPQQLSKVSSIFHAARTLSGIDSNLGRPLDEVDEYFKFTKEPDDSFDDPLKWWANIGKFRFPTIAKLARDILCGMASSVPSESSFSISSGYVTPLRARNEDQTLEVQMKLRSWNSLFEKLDV